MNSKGMMSRVRDLLTLNCRQATELLSRARDSKLTFVQELRLRLHLAMCESCSRFSKQLGILHELAHSHATEEASTPMPDQLKEKLMEMRE